MFKNQKQGIQDAILCEEINEEIKTAVPIKNKFLSKIKNLFTIKF